MLDALSAAETLVPRFCDSELVDPADWATRELDAGDPDALRLGDVDRGGLRGTDARCEAARSAVHSAAALLRAPAELAPADAAGLPRFITSLRFCCGRNMPTGSCEVQAEQLPTYQADPDSNSDLVIQAHP